MSIEASAQGTSTKCAKMTLVILEGMPHEMQNLPQDSLPLTPRPPIEGKPNGCKQEAVDSVVMAGRTKGMVETAKPTDMDVDSEKAPLGGDPAERACRVNEGDKMEHKAQLQVQESKLLCGEINQCSGNAESNVPIAYGLPLEGEWSVYSSDESDMLVIALIKPDTADGSDIPCVYLGGMRWRACNVEGPGNRMDGSCCEMDVLSSEADASKGQVDGSVGQMDTLSVSNRAVTTGLSHSEDPETYLTTEDTKCIIHEANGIGSNAEVLTGHGEIPCVGNKTETSENETGIVRTCQIGRKSQNSPYAPKNGTSKPIRQWRMVSVGEANVYLPLNAPVETSGTASRTLAFGEVESGDKAIVPSLEGERTGDDGGDRDEDDGGDGNVDSTASSSDVNLKQVEAALLAGDSQHMCQSRRTGNGDLPVSSVPPIYLSNRPYRLIMCLCRRRRLKIESINVSIA